MVRGPLPPQETLAPGSGDGRAQLSDPAGRLPVVFFGHGSPLNAIEHNRHTEAWRRVGRSLALRRPSAILSVSAHWYIDDTAVTAQPLPPTLHDFGGFPRELFEVQYPAPGDPELAARVRELLAPLPVRLAADWGLDHGTWSVLVHAFPAADVPVIQLSLDRRQPPAFHYDLGRRLRPLRDEGVLTLGSGNVVHNLRAADWTPGVPPHDWAARFSALARDLLLRGEHAGLVAYQTLGEPARLSVPTPDHFLPLLFVLGLHEPGEPVWIATEGIELGSVDMLSAVIGARAD